MSNVVQFLRKQEWSMGNGQCPICCAVHRGWHGHPLYPHIEETGHEKNCALAASLEELGEVVERKVDGFVRPEKPFDPECPIFKSMAKAVMDIWEEEFAKEEATIAQLEESGGV